MRTLSKGYTGKVDSPPLYHTGHDYTTWDTYSDRSSYTRALPPVPADCPTPMGTKGRKELPSPEYLAQTFLARRTFLPDTSRRTNVLFGFTAQHFTHQFFKTDFKKGPGRTWSDHSVDMGHVYGETTERQHQLRTFRDGKLKYQLVDGEMFPPGLQDAPVHMLYPPKVPEEKRFALGHEFFGLLPGLFVWSTVWLREHNRVCDVMKDLHPDWDDERLFQTARLILIGENIKFVIEEYVQHLAGKNFQLLWDPELLFEEKVQYQNRIFVEFNHLYHWHALMPDQFHIDGTTYDMEDYLYNSHIVLKHGFNATVDAMSRQIAGRFGPRNIGPVNLKVAVETIKAGRKLRMQSLNQYRKRFGMPPYKTFLELTAGDAEMAAQLEEAYGDIDAVELYFGWAIENPMPGSVLSQMFVRMGSTFAFTGTLSNPICSPGWWKPSTFGGEVGFNLVKTTTLKDLFCRNMNGPCGLVSFAVPEDVEPTGLPKEGAASQDKGTSQNEEL
ncbi:PTGS2 [Branchiostoma lanceolatum]|uniref:PTGS2 protein n=1 Tax=Branchiostoma lanceolatum TaxID=7740 RepID=A0A8J9ZTR4_BRALA|nr:PTGS2 [Branchiostoma lanceolatum]